MNHIFNETARKHYVSALINWKALNEQATSNALNAARDALLNGSHSTEFCDTHTQQIMPDLTVREFYGLYGDPIPAGKRTYSDWVQDEMLSDKAERHLQSLAAFYAPRELKVA